MPKPSRCICPRCGALARAGAATGRTEAIPVGHRPNRGAGAVGGWAWKSPDASLPQRREPHGIAIEGLPFGPLPAATASTGLALGCARRRPRARHGDGIRTGAAAARAGPIDEDRRLHDIQADLADEDAMAAIGSMPGRKAGGDAHGNRSAGQGAEEARCGEHAAGSPEAEPPHRCRRCPGGGQGGAQARAHEGTHRSRHLETMQRGRAPLLPQGPRRWGPFPLGSLEPGCEPAEDEEGRILEALFACRQPRPPEKGKGRGGEPRDDEQEAGSRIRQAQRHEALREEQPRRPSRGNGGIRAGASRREPGGRRKLPTTRSRPATRRRPPQRHGMQGPFPPFPRFPLRVSYNLRSVKNQSGELKWLYA